MTNVTVAAGIEDAPTAPTVGGIRGRWPRAVAAVMGLKETVVAAIGRDEADVGAELAWRIPAGRASGKLPAGPEPVDGPGYLVRRRGVVGYDRMGEDAFQAFRRAVALAGGALTLVSVDPTAREISVTRHRGGLLHGPTPERPAVCRFRDGRTSAWFFDEGRDVTARVERARRLERQVERGTALPSRSGPF